MPTTPLGIEYPVTTDSTRLAYYYERVAVTADAAVESRVTTGLTTAAKGILVNAFYAGGFALGAAAVDLPNLTGTITTTPGRRLRLIGNCQFGKGAGEPVSIAAMTVADVNNADLHLALRLGSIPAGPSNLSMVVEAIFDTTASGPFTAKLRASVNVGNLFLQTGRFTIEDAGKV